MRANTIITAGALGSLLLAQGCVATRDWVKEQMDPVSNRVSQSESRLTQTENQIGTMGNRISGVEGKLGQFEGRLGQVDAKADKALNFAFGSSNLPNQAQKEIDGFLSDLKGDPSGTGNTVLVVAGHTDNVGNDDVNYELAKKRADAVSRYLITQKKMDPLKVVSVSYGESAPLTENNNPQNRAKNRRVEILVYREGITSEPAATTPQANSPTQSETLSKRQ